MHPQVWFERYTQRLWEYHPKQDFMWDMDHLGPWIDESEIETLMAECPDDPERAAGVIFDQIVDEMETRGEVYVSPVSEKTSIWKAWLAKVLPAAIAKKL